MEGWTHLELLHSVTVQGVIGHSLTVLEGDIVHQPQGQGPCPGDRHVGDGVEEGHVRASNHRVTDLSMEGHDGDKHGVGEDLREGGREGGREEEGGREGGRGGEGGRKGGYLSTEEGQLCTV